MINAEEVPTRERILRVGSRLFAQQGFHSTTTRQIADEVGIRQPGLFHHFSSKDQIMAELQEIDFTGSCETFATAARLDLAPSISLGVALALDANRLLRSPYEMAATAQPAVFNDPAFAAGRALYEESIRLQTKLVRAGIESGELVETDPDFASAALDWVIDGILIDAQRRGSSNHDEVLDRYIRFVMRALLNDLTNLDAVIEKVHSVVAAVPQANRRDLVQ